MRAAPPPRDLRGTKSLRLAKRNRRVPPNRPSPRERTNKKSANEPVAPSPLPSPSPPGPSSRPSPPRLSPPQVKKLDNIITALDGDGARSHDRLESVIKTRESLITDPNSKAHLRVGKLKTVKAARRRGGKLAAAADSRARGEQRTTPEEDHFSDGSGDTSADAGSGGSGGSSGTAYARAPGGGPALRRGRRRPARGGGALRTASPPGRPRGRPGRLASVRRG